MCLQVVSETGLPYNTVQAYYFMEKVLKMISDKGDKNFVFKGGFLLSSLLGIDGRTTRDIDFSLQNLPLSEDVLVSKFSEILEEGCDGISFEVTKIVPIKANSLYGGYSLNILCHLENMEETIHVDVATGDPVTPNTLLYNYKSVFSEESFPVVSYNIETVIAEKLETIYELGNLNSRSKDFFDIYILYNLKKDEINFANLKEACVNTFEYRGKSFVVKDVESVINGLKEDDALKTRWDNYQKIQLRQNMIGFDEVIGSINELLICLNNVC